MNEVALPQVSSPHLSANGKIVRVMVMLPVDKG
jgi:hypothetical protein